MKRYRLSKAAVPFFKEDLATKIGDYQFWQAYNVDEKALEEVEPADLCRKDWVKIYRALGREKFIELVKKGTSLKEAKQIVKELKSKPK